MPNIEVELRALVPAGDRVRVLKRLHELGPVAQIMRVMVDFSGENRLRTVTLRVNNGRPELVAKSGGLTDNARQEAVLPVAAEAPLEESLSYLYLMGYSKAMVSLRRMHVVRTRDFEYSVRDVIQAGTNQVYSTLFDLEVLNLSEHTEGEAMTNAGQELRGLGLVPLDAGSWTEWVREVYESADKHFHYSEQAARMLASQVRAIPTPEDNFDK